jgi:hypothetical protein
MFQSRDLKALAQIVDYVKDGIFVLQFHHLASGVDAADAVGEIAPLALAVKIVDHQKSAAVEILAQACDVGGRSDTSRRCRRHTSMAS